MKKHCEWCQIEYEWDGVKYHKIEGYKQGYDASIYCGKNCQLEHMKYKRKQSNLEKYGAENCFQSKEKEEKIKQTNLERYGVTCALQNQNIKEKANITVKQKYGVENISQATEIKKRKKQTLLERYGDEHYAKFGSIKHRQVIKEKYNVENVSQHPVIRQKIKHSLLERYGDENYVNLEKIKETNTTKYWVEWYLQSDDKKIKEEATCNKLYGVDHYKQSAASKQQEIDKNIEKYGVEHYFQSQEFLSKNKLKQKRQSYILLTEKLEKETNIRLLDSEETFLNNSIFNYECLLCGKHFQSIQKNCQDIHCSCTKWRSKAERTICDWLECLEIKLENNTKKIIPPLELDIYLP